MSTLELWYQALHSEFGIEIQASNPEDARLKLYAERRKVQDSDLDGISICRSPFDPERLWLVKRKPANGEKT